MKESVYLTVLAGVAVYVISQYFLKLVFEPIISLKEALGDLSAFCLKYHAKITNGRADEKMHNELRDIVSKILSKQNAIPFYMLIRLFFGLPSKPRTLKGCKCLNYVGYEMNHDIKVDKKSDCSAIYKELKEAESFLKLRLTYDEL